MNYPPGPPYGPPRPGMPPPFGGIPPMFPPQGGMPPPLGMSGPPRGPLIGRPPLMSRPGMPSGSLHRPPPVRAPAVQAAPQLGPAGKSTTVYVGKIAATVDDKDVKALLEACGPVKSWKPMLDPDTQKSKGFGFCEYEEIEGVVRAVKLLHNLNVDGQELQLKCTTATQRYMDEYLVKKQQKQHEAEKDKEDGEAAGRNPDDIADDEALSTVMEIVSRRAAQTQVPNAADQASKFLSSLNENGSTAGEGKEVVERTRKSRDKDERERARELDRELERERERQKRDEELKREEAERVYRERLREWERYERDRVKLLEAEKERERELENERLRQVKVETEEIATDDDVEEWRRKPYRASRRYTERRRRRAREEEEDEIDRIKEAKERKRHRVSHDRQDSDHHRSSKAATPTPQLDGTVGHHAARTSSVAASEPSADVDMNDPIYRAMMNAAKAAPRAPSPSPLPGAPATTASLPGPPPRPHPTEAPAGPPSSSDMADPHSGRAVPNAKKKVLSVFGDDEEDDKPKRKLIPIQYSAEEMKALHSGTSKGNESDEKSVVKGIIDRIPTTKEDVFAYKINWGAFDAAQPGLSNSLTLWTSKKIKELLGEEEETLVSFIMEKLGSHSTAVALHEELQNVLDEEAETFVLKLYRTVIFETEKYAVLGS